MSPYLEREGEREKTESGQFTMEAEVVNISRSGMSVECSEKLNKEKVYAATIFLYSSVFHVTCRVAWTLDDGSGHRFRSGVKFVQMNHSMAGDLSSYFRECTTDLGRRLHLRTKTAITRVLFNEV